MKRIWNPLFIGLLIIAAIFAGACTPVPHEILDARAQAAVEQAVAHEIGVFDLVAYDANGREIWRDTAYNALADEGEQAMLDVYLRGGTAPTQFYLRLYNDTPIETDGLADLTGEPSTNGYAAQLIERSSTGWPTLALDSGDYQATSTEETFAASGGSWGPVTYCVLATTSDNTGLLVSFAALSQSRTLADGESLKITYRVKQQ